MQDEWIADWREAEDSRHEEYDPSIVWIPRRLVNEKERARAWTVWKYTDAHKDAQYCNGDFTSFSKKRSDDHPFHYLDGVSVILTRDGDPEDRWYEAGPVDLAKMFGQDSRGSSD